MREDVILGSSLRSVSRVRFEEQNDEPWEMYCPGGRVAGVYIFILAGNLPNQIQQK